VVVVWLSIKLFGGGIMINDYEVVSASYSDKLSVMGIGPGYTVKAGEEVQFQAGMIPRDSSNFTYSMILLEENNDPGRLEADGRYFAPARPSGFTFLLVASKGGDLEKSCGMEVKVLGTNS
jgi:hypothetical protein